MVKEDKIYMADKAARPLNLQNIASLIRAQNDEIL